MLGPLLLTALLGFSSSCPLILKPPELVRELGESAVINCTTNAEGNRSMYWTYNDEKQTEDSDSYVALLISQTDWNTTAKCTIKVNETFECSEELQIKVFKRPSNITVHSNAPAVEGKHLELKCEVSGVATIQNLTVTWFMNHTVKKTEYFPSTNSTTTVGSALVWNVSREHHGNTFTCEASETGPHGPLFVSNYTWKLSVEYAPKFEEDEYNLHLNKSSDVSLRCEAIGNPPPHYSWITNGTTVANNTNYHNMSAVSENVMFSCVASNNHGFATKTFVVTVIGARPAAPKSPGCPLTIAPDKILVKFGDPAFANCSTTEVDAEGLGWEATSGGKGLTEGTHLEWKVDKVEMWAISAGCYITRKDGVQCTKHLSITVWKSPDEVHVSPEGNRTMIEEKPHYLKCDVFNFAPAKNLQVNWYQDGKLIHTNTNILNGSNVTPTNAISILELIPKKEQNGANFTCEAELLLGQKEPTPRVVSLPFTASVQYKPSVSGCRDKIDEAENVLKLDAVECDVKGNPDPTVVWYHKNKPVDSTRLLTRTDSGKYTASFTNNIGQINASFEITIEYGPSFSCKYSYNVTENMNLGPGCEPEGKPQPKLVLFKDGATFSLPKTWTKEDSGQYTMVATNAHGRANHSLSINVLYLSRFAEESITKEINQGENLTLECTTDGNPPPQLVWGTHPPAENLRVTSRGRHSHIHVIEATSSSAGLYVCTATNEVGSVSKNVTLLIRIDQSRSLSVILICVAIAVLLLILVLVLMCRTCRKKSGHYDIIGSSSVALTTMS